MNKKILSLVTTAAVFASTVPALSVSAAEQTEFREATFTLTPSKTTAEAGDTITYTLSYETPSAMVDGENQIYTFCLDLPEGVSLVVKDRETKTSVVDRSVTWNDEDLTKAYFNVDGSLARDFLTNVAFIEKWKATYPSVDVTDPDLLADPYKFFLVAEYSEYNEKTDTDNPTTDTIGKIDVATFDVVLDSDIKDGNYTVGLTKFNAPFTLPDGYKQDETNAITVKTKTTAVKVGDGSAPDSQTESTPDSQTESTPDSTVESTVDPVESSSVAEPTSSTTESKDDSSSTVTLKKVEAKAATETEEGNIEYYYDEANGKYYSDAAGTKEITKADTVVPKKTANSTGTSSNTDSKNNNSSKTNSSGKSTSSAGSSNTTSNPNTGVAPAIMSLGVLAMGAIVVSKKRK